MGGNNTENNTMQHNPLSIGFRASLLVIYTVTLFGGTLGIVFMVRFLRRSKNKLSITTTSIINLVMAHGLFLLTVPFRIDYYAANTWRYTFEFCKLVSIAIHTHLYISFFFYVAILAVRLLPCLPTRDFYRPLTAFVASAAVWIVFTITIFPPLWLHYGKRGKYNESQCFQFHVEIKGERVKWLNISIATMVILISAVIITIQMLFLARVVRSNPGNLFSQQEFRAQLKNLTFLTFLVVCFLPYHAFRIYYVLHVDGKNSGHNEIYLSLTTLCCLDLLTFLAI
ncbi:probable G-protein coupled receptor 141 isoform X1 [Anguilla anguilla]|uniref:probable G-protein coupled receptor 141 isoform X1 n=1 Tax=Anguilla anguilla TaxID=7936 RepID=UPI0015AA7D22|nr:probable G-protein coupled receptor 141 isoform X1 [Anguilla anguilla]XP_035269678.1 probable G-protein coupled receptor 141 isoform X1 [Anguilla anguilla]XP_035269679.1 probable G-protein coupled receptor 141 isoform X1 [Anguilla anguilla]